MIWYLVSAALKRVSALPNTAQKVREMKEKNPQAYCPKCLWRTNGNYTPCPRHTSNTQENTNEESHI